MTQFEKDLYRLTVLRKICEAFDYNTSPIYHFENDTHCAECIEEENNEKFKNCLGFLYDKHYINLKRWMNGGYGFITLLPEGRDLIERINRKSETKVYENDFDKAAIEWLKSESDYPNIVLSVNINSTIKTINEIENNLLSNEDKDTIITLLKEISQKLPKEKKESKARKILSFLGDKSFQVILAVLPQVLESIGKG